jgi:Spy/CpxP family protein refolding chaperone
VDAPEDDPALNVTDDQKAQIKTIREDSKQQMAAVDKDTSLTDEQRQRKAKQIKMATRKQVWGVLTPEQQKAWAEESRERHEAKHQTEKPPE